MIAQNNSWTWKPLGDDVPGLGDGGADVVEGRGGLEGDGLGGKVGGDLGFGVNFYDGFAYSFNATFTHNGGNREFHSY